MDVPRRFYRRMRAWSTGKRLSIQPRPSNLSPKRRIRRATLRKVATSLKRATKRQGWTLFGNVPNLDNTAQIRRAAKILPRDCYSKPEGRGYTAQIKNAAKFLGYDYRNPLGFQKL